MIGKIKAYIKELSTYCNIPFVRSEQSGVRPGELFLSYKILSNQPEPEQCVIIKYLEKDDTQAIKQKIKESEIIVSLTFIGNEDNFGNVWDATNKAYDFIDSIEGFEAACAIGIGVSVKGPIQDRTVFLETSYEYRLGFDIIIRNEMITEVIIDAVDINATLYNL
ncbi:MAG: hypothetical protein AB1444_00285 [Spirochaetota bacterium]